MVYHKRQDIGGSMNEIDKKIIEFLQEICPGEFQGGAMCFVSMNKDGKAHTGSGICGKVTAEDMLGISSSMMAITSKIFKDASIALAQIVKSKQEVTEAECAEAGAAILAAATVSQANIKNGREFKYMEE